MHRNLLHIIVPSMNMLSFSIQNSQQQFKKTGDAKHRTSSVNVNAFICLKSANIFPGDFTFPFDCCQFNWDGSYSILHVHWLVGLGSWVSLSLSTIVLLQFYHRYCQAMDIDVACFSLYYTCLCCIFFCPLSHSCIVWQPKQFSSE